MVPLADVQIATGSVAAMSSTIIRSRRRTNVEKPVTAVIERPIRHNSCLISLADEKTRPDNVVGLNQRVTL